MALGDKLLKLRKERKLSQEKLARLIGTSGPIIGRYERGEMVPSVEVASKLADVFDVTLDYLANDTAHVAEIKDKDMLKRLTEMAQLNEEDRTIILKVLDSLLRDAKAKKVYGA
jgi:transcriptional regulator with XRE-family HTH domain